jgi:NAD(P)-dependent dehydrogenase (short-subunit alcohol dehydrogenase family)
MIKALKDKQAVVIGASPGVGLATVRQLVTEGALDADKVASAVVGGLRGDLADGVTAIGVTGEGVESVE